VAARAQSAPEPFRIMDNSFLVEEAFNQERGIFQNIFGLTRIGGAWAATFTQEWPAPSQTHQLSYTVSWLNNGDRGAGDALINYRFQALMDGPGRPAFSPRVSLVLPTGDFRRRLGSGSAGVQVNLPFSKQTDDWFWHWNGGLTWFPRAKAEAVDGSERREALTSPFVSGSAIYRVAPMLHLMVESVAAFDEAIADIDTTRQNAFTISPGFRAGWDVGDKQVVVGFAVPTTWTSDERFTGALFYFSYELPFLKPKP
jgi:hypothetical protein